VAAQLMPTSEERSLPSRLLESFAFRFEVEAVGGIRFISSPLAIGPLQEGLNTSFREIVGSTRNYAESGGGTPG
jgi:hypothetical protein